MLERIITGGQTGVDQAAWRSAKRWGYKTSGMMPKDFLTEHGFRPEFAELYGATKSRSSEFRPGIQTNVQAANAVLWLGPTESPVYLATLAACSHNKNIGNPKMVHSLSRRIITIKDMKRRLAEVSTTESAALSMIPTRDFLMSLTTVFITGPMEFSEPGIGEMAERFMDTVFHMIKNKMEWDRKKFQEKLALRGKTREITDLDLDEDNESLEEDSS